MIDVCFALKETSTKENSNDWWVKNYSKFEINTLENKILFSKVKNRLVSEYTFTVNDDRWTFKEKELKELNFSEIFENVSNNQQSNNNYRRVNFIEPSKTISSHLANYYESIQEENREDEIDGYISKFDPSIKRLKFFANGHIKLEKNGKYQPIHTFGDGIKAYLAIILAIFAGKDSYLFIDELENGIHYTQFDQLWRIILSASKEVNCQIFATTHSKECIDSYARIAKKRMDEEIAFIELGRNKKNELKAMVYPYEWFLDEIEQDHEVRGW
jgi:AAA15 family ATPase/GTPase